MNQGFNLIIYPVTSLEQAKPIYTQLLGSEPYVDQPYYVGYKVGEQEVGLIPKDQDEGGSIPYFHVTNIQESVQSLLSAGATVQQDVKNVGGGLLTAIILDADHNVIGLRQFPQ